MTHQPYENWLLHDSRWQGEVLSEQEVSALRQHMAGCQDCRQIASAWMSIQEVLQSPTMISPQSGFSHRWQARMQIERNRLHRRQSILVLSVSLAFAAVLLFLIFYLNWTFLSSPRLLIWTMIYQMLRWFSIVEVIQQTIVGFSRAIKISVPISIWLLAIGILCQLCVLWIASFRSLLVPRRVSK